MGVWARKFRFSLTLLHTPFNSSWCYILFMKNLFLKMGLSVNSATKNSDLGISGNFWRDGADSSQKVDTLAGRRVSSTPGKRLAEAWRASTRLGTCRGGPRWCITVRKSLFQTCTDWVETFSIVRLYILTNITMRLGGIIRFSLHPPLLHTPFNSSWCYYTTK